MSDSNKEILKTLNSIADTLKNLERAAQTMAQAKVASVVYTNETLQAKLAEFQRLIDADTEAFNQLTKSHEDLKAEFGDIGFDERAKQYGQEAAKQQNENVTKSHEWRKKTSQAFDAFRKEHPIITTLHESMVRKPLN